MMTTIENSLNTVEISRTEYDRLVTTKHSYRLLVEALLNEARLNYSGDKLIFDDAHGVDALLKYLKPELYNERLEELKEAKEVKAK